MNQKAKLEEFRCLPPVEPQELYGLWRGRGIATGHPLDGVLENLGWFGKRFREDLRADALLFRSGERRLVAIDPSRVPLGLVLAFHKFGRTRAARNLFSYIERGFRASGPVATLRAIPFDGVLSSAMVYDSQPIIDHFRRIDDRKLMGAMTVESDARLYFFELERVEDVGGEDQSNGA